MKCQVKYVDSRDTKIGGYNHTISSVRAFNKAKAAGFVVGDAFKRATEPSGSLWRTSIDSPNFEAVKQFDSAASVIWNRQNPWVKI